jgi:hypothetical protein
VRRGGCSSGAGLSAQWAHGDAVLPVCFVALVVLVLVLVLVVVRVVVRVEPLELVGDLECLQELPAGSPSVRAGSVRAQDRTVCVCVCGPRRRSR